MAADQNPSIINKKRRRAGFMHLLSSAASEWFLILLLFAHASLSYLLTKFASYCELETPCLLCSNLDNAFGQNKRGYYWNLLCTHHRQEISCLVSCSIHDKFADVQSMCDECLAPIIDRSKSSSDSYRLLVGKSWLDVDRSVLQNLVLNKHVRLGSPDHRTCSCCGKTWKAKSGTERLLEFNPVNDGASKANLKPPLPRAPGSSRFSRRDSLKRLRDKFSGQMLSLSSVDTLSHVGYTKLKISSDTESEFLFSDDECRSTGSRVGSCSDKRSVPNMIDFSFEDRSGMPSPTDVFKQMGLEDFEWPNSPCLTRDLMASNGCDVPGGFFGGSAESSKSNVIIPHMQALSVLSEFLSMCSIPPSPDANVTPKKFDVSGTSENGDNTSEAGNIEASLGTSSDDARSLGSTNALNQTDETFEFNFTTTSDSAKTEKDIKPIKETSPQDHNPRTDEDDSSNSKALPIPASPKKPDSDYESSDGTAFMEPESENIIDSLKRQDENDRSLLNNLYKDLEEERNAAAIAANQAMAMITRLQEEKAALHMEALQYLRMMEEQSEYDMEALGRANDLLADKEKELQDLEIELEFYRNNFLDESGVHNLQSETSVVVNQATDVTPKENGVCEPMNSSLTDFEEEKAYIARCLQKLEKKLFQAFFGGEYDDLPNSLRSENINGTLLIQEIEEDSSFMENVIPLSNVNHDFVHEKSKKNSTNQGEINFAKFEKEIKEIYERLRAIEADQDLIKRTCGLLHSGKDGLELVKEIAQQLHELRKIEFVKR
ncbi:hypothetical protein CASFOL_010127 [Castilleja foliolosa]|uniref:GTD-binding domain-containing protein n=1 Tax=Castilleja foliolosa TaxID=1961234 RepID=A0ABD3DTJ3_9LAMI